MILPQLLDKTWSKITSQVINRDDKTFIVKVKGLDETITIDHLKPAFILSEAHVRDGTSIQVHKIQTTFGSYSDSATRPAAS